MSSISDWGFRLVQEDSGEDWAVLRWELAGINERPTYGFSSTGLEKGIGAVTGRLMTFLGGYDLYDHTELISDISGNCVMQKTDAAAFLERADLEYLAGNYKTAKTYYQKYEDILNDKQKMRLKRILDDGI